MVWQVGPLPPVAHVNGADPKVPGCRYEDLVILLFKSLPVTMLQDYFLRDRQAPTRKISVVNMVVPFVTGMDSPTAYAAHQVWFVDDWQDRFNSSTRRSKNWEFLTFFYSEKPPWLGGFWWFEKKTPEVSNLCASRRSKLRRWFFNLSSCSGGVGCGDGYDGKIHGGLPKSMF